MAIARPDAAMFRRLQTYVYAAASEGVMALCAFGVLYALGIRHDKETVAIYLLVRRVVAVLVPAVSIGMPLALVRNLVLCRAGGSRLVALATLVVTGGIVGVSILAGLAGGAFTQVGLGVQGYEYLTWPIVTMSLGVALTTITVGVLRARERIAAATTQLILMLGVVPLATVFVTPDLWWFLLLVGGTQGLVSLGVLARDLLSRWPPEPVRTRDFITFGAKATSAEFAMMVLLWLPPATISRSESVAVSGYFSLILSLVMLLASPIAPVATSIMPRISAAVARQDGAALRRIVITIAAVALVGGTAMVAIGSVLYEFLAQLVLGNGESLGPRATLTILTAIVPLAIVYGLRNAIDVVWSPLHNTAILAVGICVFLGTNLAVNRWTEIAARVGVVVGFTLAVWVIAACAVGHGILIIRKWSVRFDEATV